ncbi:cupin domain-containing protein [Acidobacteria bacterium AH-259-G07]|nr:cupin domain-containing protein [Acidobacteria bacterium AH-259-G07]
MKVSIKLSVFVLVCTFCPWTLAQYQRPTFDGPAHIPYASVTKAFWGENDTMGYASDLVYVSNLKIHQLLFQMPPGAFYRSSRDNPVIYGADEVWHVLSGTLAINNPANGEMHVVNKGEAVFFRKDTWHHGFSFGKEPVRVLEHFAPPPLAGTTGTYSTSKPFLEEFKEAQDKWIGQWPMSRAKVEDTFTMEVMDDSDLLWRLEGQALVGLYASTENLTSGKMIILPGQKTDRHEHGGDESVYFLEGKSLDIVTFQDGEKQSFVLEPKDGFYVPEGTPHQYFNMSEEPAILLFQVAPNYLPEKK